MTETESKVMRDSQMLETVKKHPPQTKREIPTLSHERGKDGSVNVALSGDFLRIKAGTGNTNVSIGLLAQISSLGSHGKPCDAVAANFALGFVDSMAPKDAAETLLLGQMAAIHQATMMMARRLNHVDNIPQQDAAERALNKLARTYAGQVETLKRYRSKGQQVVRVEHVTVNAGGQAIVGNVNHGGRGADEK